MKKEDLIDSLRCVRGYESKPPIDTHTTHPSNQKLCIANCNCLAVDIQQEFVLLGSNGLMCRYVEISMCADLLVFAVPIRFSSNPRLSVWDCGVYVLVCVFLPLPFPTEVVAGIPSFPCVLFSVLMPSI
jgi:hypothetical protein